MAGGGGISPQGVGGQLLPRVQSVVCLGRAFADGRAGHPAFQVEDKQGSLLAPVCWTLSLVVSRSWHGGRGAAQAVLATLPWAWLCPWLRLAPGAWRARPLPFPGHLPLPSFLEVAGCCVSPLPPAGAPFFNSEGGVSRRQTQGFSASAWPPAQTPPRGAPPSAPVPAPLAQNSAQLCRHPRLGCGVPWAQASHLQLPLLSHCLHWRRLPSTRLRAPPGHGCSSCALSHASLCWGWDLPVTKPQAWAFGIPLVSSRGPASCPFPALTSGAWPACLGGGGLCPQDSRGKVDCVPRILGGGLCPQAPRTGRSAHSWSEKGPGPRTVPSTS